MSRDQSPVYGEQMNPVRSWMAIISLSLGAFIIVTTELMPIGLLSLIAGDLDETQAKIGLTVTGYAWVGAISAVLLTTLVSTVERRLLFVILMAVLAFANFLASNSDTFSSLMSARVLGAISHGIFWSMISALAIRIAPPGQAGKATAVVFTGVSVASVLGVPLSTLLGQQFGWQFSFVLIAILTCLLIGIACILIPKIESSTSNGLAAAFSILKRNDLRLVYLVAGLAVTGHFLAFTYLVPYIEKVVEVSPSMVATLLLLFGLAGVGGNFLTGMYVDKYLRLTLFAAMLSSVVAMVMLYIASSHFYTLVFLLLLWGAGISALFVSMQIWVIRLAPEAADIASSFYVGIFNAAIGAGALAGSLVLSFSDVVYVPIVGAFFVIFALLLVKLFYRYASKFEEY